LAESLGPPERPWYIRHLSGLAAVGAAGLTATAAFFVNWWQRAQQRKAVAGALVAEIRTLISIYENICYSIISCESNNRKFVFSRLQDRLADPTVYPNLVDQVGRIPKKHSQRLVAIYEDYSRFQRKIADWQAYTYSNSDVLDEDMRQKVYWKARENAKNATKCVDELSFEVVDTGVFNRRKHDILNMEDWYSKKPNAPPLRVADAAALDRSAPKTRTVRWGGCKVFGQQ